jgi:dTDP-glucose 4,6-dehydratase
LGLAKAKGARFLLASTSEVYGDPLLNPQPETYWGNVNPIGARGVYDEAKRFAEAMTMAYHRYHGVDTRIVRIFNTYGPRMRPKDGRVVSNFIVQALQGKPLTVFGDGSQTRSFCYVDDLVRGIVALLMVKSDKSVAERTDRTKFLTQKPDAILDSIHDPVNIGNPRELTVRGIAEIILKINRF